MHERTRCYFYFQSRLNGVVDGFETEVLTIDYLSIIQIQMPSVALAIDYSIN